MSDSTRGDGLLNLARRTLLDELMPLLPPEKTYEARMLARAMGIAARELTLRDSAVRDGARRIAAFLERSGAPGGDPDERHLAGLIRRRAITPACGPALYDLLMALTRAKLAISNPRHLSGKQV